MESTGTKQAREKVVTPDAVKVAVSTSVAANTLPPPARTAYVSNVAMERPTIGYGLPCANCRAYYPSDMHACPICKSQERVSPTATVQIARPPAEPQTEETPSLTEERERLRELKSQIYSQVPATTFRCALDQNHSGNAEPAAVCHSCYGDARQQADRLEAALHIDNKEAAKIVYDAVWADTSDPNKTYLNAASALLSELRRRAGIGLLLGGNQPLAH
jgi:hypothetical protein